jgi:hypothetical protein
MELLVSHDGELADICRLLGELGCPFTERRGPLAPTDAGRAWDLVVATPARVQRLEPLLARRETRCIAVAEGSGSKGATLRLFRAGVDLVIRRPVHPATLRLVLIHALYEGPERRRDARVGVGLPVRYRTGWLPRRGLLQELSLRGAGLLLPRRLQPGRPVTVSIPGESGPLDLAGEVVRCRPEREFPGSWLVGVAFERAPGAASAGLRQLLRRYSVGPGVLPGSLAPAREPEGIERRVAERRPYERRVIALGDGGARVLLGRDLSLGGMRVEAREGLRPGQQFRVALHALPGEVPLVIDAETVRDDGCGLALRFRNVSDAARLHLAKLVDQLPALSAAREGLEEPRFLAELVEGPSGAAGTQPVEGSD